MSQYRNNLTHAPLSQLRSLSISRGQFRAGLAYRHLWEERIILHLHYDMRKFNFSNRITPIWNSLPDHVVASPTINTFKARLDKLWENQDVRYDTIRYDTVYLTCSKKLTDSQLSPPHGTNKKLKCETKNKTMSMIGPVQSHCHEGSPVGKKV